MLPSEIGATQGRRISSRTSHLPAEVLLQRDAQGGGEEDHDDLRDDGEEEGVLQGRIELGGSDHIGEVLQTDEVEPAAPQGDAAHAVVEGQEERQANQQDDVEDGWPDHERAQGPLAVDPGEARGSAGFRRRRTLLGRALRGHRLIDPYSARAGMRHSVTLSKNLRPCRGTANAYRSPGSMTVPAVEGDLGDHSRVLEFALERAVEEPIGAEVLRTGHAEGTTAVAVGTANFRDPLAGNRVREELAAGLREAGADAPSDVRGRIAASTST